MIDHFQKICINFVERDSINKYNSIKEIKNQQELKEFQINNLKNLILHAYLMVPYYNCLFKKIGIIKNGDVLVEMFNKVPLLKRMIIKEQCKDLLSHDYKKRKIYNNFTGGSSGIPLKFVQDYEYLTWSKAITNYYYETFLNVNEFHTKKIILWGSESDLFKGKMPIRNRIFYKLTNTVLLNSFKMKEDDMETYIKKINKYKPELIRGYAGSLYELSKFAEENNHSIHKPRIIISAAETLKEYMRVKIENVFDCKVYNFYGSREIATIAGECKCGGMHVFPFWNYSEILKDNNKLAKKGEEGRIVLTNLFNYAMPFIRYEIGDLAVMGGKCKCGSILPKFDKVSGRIVDHFKLKDGSVVPAEYFIHLIGVVCKIENIEKFQVLQEDFDKIKISVVSSVGLKRFEQVDIENKIRLVMGNDCKVYWDFVDDIPKTKSGKYVYTKSLVWD